MPDVPRETAVWVNVSDADRKKIISWLDGSWPDAPFAERVRLARALGIGIDSDELATDGSRLAVARLRRAFFEAMTTAEKDSTYEGGIWAKVIPYVNRALAGPAEGLNPGDPSDGEIRMAMDTLGLDPNEHSNYLNTRRALLDFKRARLAQAQEALWARP